MRISPQFFLQLSVSAPSPVAPRKTWFGRELEQALKHALKQRNLPIKEGELSESTSEIAGAVAKPLTPAPVALPAAGRHDLHPPHVIERDVFVRLVTPPSETRLAVSNAGGSPAYEQRIVTGEIESSEPPEGEASIPREAHAIDHADRHRPADYAQPAVRAGGVRATQLLLQGTRAVAWEIESSEPPEGKTSLPREAHATDHADREPGVEAAQPAVRAGGLRETQLLLQETRAVAWEIESSEPPERVASIPREAHVIDHADRQPPVDYARPEASAPHRDPGAPLARPFKNLHSALKTEDLPDGADRAPAVATVMKRDPALSSPAAEPAPEPRTPLVNRALDVVRQRTIDTWAGEKAAEVEFRLRLPGTSPPTPPDSENGARRDDSATPQRWSPPIERVHSIQVPVSEPPVPAAIAGAVTQITATGLTAPSSALPSLRPELTSPTSALIDQVVQQLTAAPNHGTFTLRLDPPELGALIVRFQRRGGQLTVTMSVERDDVARILRHDLPQLEASLSHLREPVQVQIETHAAGQGRTDNGASGSRGERELEPRRDERPHEQNAATRRDPPPQRSRRALRDARLDVWS